MDNLDKADGRRLEDTEVITNYPTPPSAERRQHFLRYFYTRPGLWLHGLGFLLAFVDSNANLPKTWWPLAEEELFERVFDILKTAGLQKRIDYLKTPPAAEELRRLRQRWQGHRASYCSRFPVPVTTSVT